MLEQVFVVPAYVAELVLVLKASAALMFAEQWSVIVVSPEINQTNECVFLFKLNANSCRSQLTFLSLFVDDSIGGLL